MLFSLLSFYIYVLFRGSLTLFLSLYNFKLSQAKTISELAEKLLADHMVRHATHDKYKFQLNFANFQLGEPSKAKNQSDQEWRYLQKQLEVRRQNINYKFINVNVYVYVYVYICKNFNSQAKISTLQEEVTTLLLNYILVNINVYVYVYILHLLIDLYF